MMRKAITGLLIVCISLIFAPLASAQDVRNSHDIKGLERFPNAFIERFRERDNTEHRLVLSALDKVNGRVRAEREGLEKGQLTQITYRIPEGHSPEAAFTAMRQQLLALDTPSPMKLLFECNGRDCGSSNHWANRVFRNPALYGLTESQYYLIAQTAGQYFIVYAVQRGNKRVYLQLDHLIYQDAHTSLSADRNQFIVLSEEQEPSAALIASLTNNPETIVWVIGYDRATMPYQTALSHAAKLALAVKSRLIKQGIAEQRIQTTTVGGFVPLMVAEGSRGVYLMLE